MTAEPGLLRGLRVVDCSSGSAGPLATGVLADHGADVVWVEPPGGDPYRGVLDGYPAWNRGKRSVVLDLERPDDQARLLDLLGSADVLVESWDAQPPFDPHVLRRLPSLVHCSVTAYGPGRASPRAAARDALVEAELGVMDDAWGHRAAPIYPGVHFAGLGAAYLAVLGTLAALRLRLRDGHGRQVETSLFDGALAFMNMYWVLADPPLVSISKSGDNSRRRRVIGAWPCGDGAWISLHTGASGAHARLMAELGLDDRVAPAGHAVEATVPLSADEAALLATELPRILATRPRAYWLERLLAADVCAMPVNEPGEAFDDPQVRHNRLIVRIDDPVLGPVMQVGPPLQVSGHRHIPQAPQPAVGDAAVATVVAEWAAPSPWRTAPADDAALLTDVAPLEGVRVLDYGAYVAGPYGSRLLADLGADVIKVEPPAGDQMRPTVQPFHLAQRGKRAICLNLKDPGDREVNARLVATADVVAHNMRPGAAERMGIGIDDVRAANPDAVYAYSPGWGSTGPASLHQGFAPLFSGVAGLQMLTGGVGNPPIQPIGNEDNANGLLGAAGMLMALLHRERSGEAVYLENPQINATLAMTAQVMRGVDGVVRPFARLDADQTGFEATDRLYRTRDGWVCVVAQLDPEFAALVEALGQPELGTDPRFTSTAGRRAASAELAGLLAPCFAQLDTATARERLAAAGVQCAVPADNGAERFLHDPEQQALGRAAVDDHPRLGTVWSIATLVRVSDTRQVRTSRPPELDEHTREILDELRVGSQAGRRPIATRASEHSR